MRYCIVVVCLLVSCIGGGQETPPPAGPKITPGILLGRCVEACLKDCVSEACEGQDTKECRQEERYNCIPACREVCTDEVFGSSNETTEDEG